MEIEIQYNSRKHWKLFHESYQKDELSVISLEINPEFEEKYRIDWVSSDNYFWWINDS